MQKARSVNPPPQIQAGDLSYKPQIARKQNRNKKTETSLNRQQHPYSRQQLHIRHYKPYTYTPIRTLPLRSPRLLPIWHYTRIRHTPICHSLPYIPTITRSTLTYLLTCALYYAPDLHPWSVTLLLQPCHVCVTFTPSLTRYQPTGSLSDPLSDPLSAHRNGQGWGNYINYVNPTNYIN